MLLFNFYNHTTLIVDENQEINHFLYDDFIIFLKELFENRDFIVLKEHHSILENFGFRKNDKKEEIYETLEYLLFYTGLEVKKVERFTGFCEYIHIEFSDEAWNKTLSLKKKLDKLYMDIVKHPLIGFLLFNVTSKELFGYMNTIQMGFTFSTRQAGEFNKELKESFYVEELLIVAGMSICELLMQDNYETIREKMYRRINEVYEENELIFLMNEKMDHFVRYYRYFSILLWFDEVAYQIKKTDTIQKIKIFDKIHLMAEKNTKYIDSLFSSKLEMDSFFQHFFIYLLNKTNIKKPIDFRNFVGETYQNIGISSYELPRDDKIKFIIFGFSFKEKELYMISVNDLEAKIALNDYEIQCKVGSLKDIEDVLIDYDIVLTEEEKQGIQLSVNNLLD